MMHLRPLRFTLFVYDLVRLAALLGVLFAVFPGMGGSAEGATTLPLVAFAAPNALFPLMGLFLALRSQDYAPFAALYAAGKAVFVSATVAWFVFSFEAILDALSFDALGAFRAVGTLALLTLLDVATVPVALKIAGKDRRRAADSVDERLPDYAVDEVAPVQPDGGGA